MAGSLIKINEAIVTTATPSVTLTGIDSTYDVYMVKYNNVEVDTSSRYLQFRVTESGTPNTTTNYTQAQKTFRTAAAFINNTYTNNFVYANVSVLGTSTGSSTNGVFYIFNANNSSEYTFGTIEVNYINITPELFGDAGGFVFKQTSIVDGIQFILSGTGNIDSGTFTLYGLKK